MIDYSEKLQNETISNPDKDFYDITKTLYLITMIIKKLRSGKQKLGRLSSIPNNATKEESIDHSDLLHLLHGEHLINTTKLNILSSSEDLYLKHLNQNLLIVIKEER